MILDSYATFEAQHYLAEYYSTIGAENSALLKFFATAYRGLPKNSVMLEFSGGPTLYSLISAAKTVSEIHFSDYLPQNLAEINCWVSGIRQTDLWDRYFEEALRLEGMTDVTPAAVQERMALLRQKITNLLFCDAFSATPLADSPRQTYDVVAANFVAESITRTMLEWQTVVGNICSTLRPGGTLIMTALAGASHYTVSDRNYAAVAISEMDVVQALIRAGFQPNSILVQSIGAETQDNHDDEYKGYQGMIFIKARKSSR
jgi:NNMT/PNMT/TEMT family